MTLIFTRVREDHIDVERCSQGSIKYDATEEGVADSIVDYVTILLGNVEHVDPLAVRAEVCRRLAVRPGDYDPQLGVVDVDLRFVAGAA